MSADATGPALYRARLSYATYGIEVLEGRVVRAAPIASWMVGKGLSEVERWVTGRAAGWKKCDQRRAMDKFPVGLEDKPHTAQLAKEVWEALGCKDPLTRTFIRVVFVAVQVFDWKQQMYGTKNIAQKGAKGVVTRLWDKVSRLDNIYEKGQQDTVSGEPVEDTFGDSGVYGIIGLMCRYKLWPGSPEQAERREVGQ